MRWSMTEITDITNEIEKIIKRSGRKMTTDEINNALYGFSNVKLRSSTNYYIRKLLKNGKIKRYGVRSKPRDPPYLYGTLIEPIETDICNICGTVRTSGDIHEGVCSICDEMLTQTHPSSGNNKPIKEVPKVRNGFQNPHISYVRTDRGQKKIDVISSLAGRNAEITIKLQGIVQGIDHGNLKIQTSRGPVYIALHDIVSIGEIDEPRR
jgi:hypothetical protein